MNALGIEKLKEVTICDLAMLIFEEQNLGMKVSAYARPYLNAMLEINSINDMYGADTAYSVVAYFLSNAGTMRGDVTKTVKAELKRRMKEYEKARK